MIDYLLVVVCYVVFGVVVIMGMNNVFYCGCGFFEGWYDDLCFGLWMNIIVNLGILKVNFEFWFFVVFVINGCLYCFVVYEYMLCMVGVD